MTSPRSTFFHYLARYRLQLVAGAVLAAGSSLAAVVPPRFIGAIIDSLGRAGTQFEDVLRLALLIVGFFIWRGVKKNAAFLAEQERATATLRECEGASPIL